MPSMPPADCKTEVDKAGNLLGGDWRLALYSTTPSDVGRKSTFKAYRATFSKVLPEPDTATQYEMTYNPSNPTICPKAGPITVRKT